MRAFTTLAVLVAAFQHVSAYNCATHTYGTCADGIVHWYDPDDGQICDLLDCGGGRAPPKTDVPCCAAYKGTQACVTTPSYMPCFKKAAATSAAPPPAVTTTPVVVAPSTTATTYVLTSSTAQVQSTAIAAPQTTSSTTMATAQPATSTSSTSVMSAMITSVSTKAMSTSQTSKASSSAASSAVVSTPSNAAGFVQYESVVAYLGVALGLLAAI